MKISNLTAQHFQGIDYLSLDIPDKKPIVLLAGKNATGKTSIRDAIRLALIGDSARVNLKKDYPAMVRRGANPKEAFVSVTADGFTWKRNVASGKSDTDLPDYPLVMPFLLGSTRFAELPSREKLPILYKVTGTKTKVSATQDIMREMKVDEECVLAVGPSLTLGFAKGHQYCKEQQTEARGAWKAITGETYGELKAEKWKPTLVEYDIDALKDQRQNLKNTVEDLKEELDELVQEENAALLALERRKAAEPEPTQPLPRNSAHEALNCPVCNAVLMMGHNDLVLYVAQQKPKRTKKPVEAAPPVAAPSTGPSLLDFRAKVRECQGKLNPVEMQLGQVNAEIAKAERQEIEAEEKRVKAYNYFMTYNMWEVAANALADDGIPLRLLKQAIKPLNDRLNNTSKLTGWSAIEMSRDLEVTYGGTPYGLCSESEQWRVDAALADAISSLSGVRFFVLDRMDVLHPDERIALIKWLMQIKADHDTIIVLATLKTPPSGMDPTYLSAWWLDEGGEAEKVV